MGITCHFIEDDENQLSLHDRILCVRALSVDQTKTGEYLLSEVKKVLAEFSLLGAYCLNKIMVVTDRGKNMVAAFKKDNDRLSCFAHLVNNVVQKCCKLSTVVSILTPVKKTVRFMKVTGLNNKLDSSLKSFVKTRFNTNTEMLNSIYLNWDSVNDILSERNELQHLERSELEPPENVEKEDVKMLIDFFGIFKNATDEIEQSKRPTLYLVWTWIIRFNEHLAINRSDSRLLKVLKTVASKYLKENFVFHNFFKIAVFLHPLCKGLQKFCKNEQEKEEIYSLTKSMMAVNINDSTPTRLQNRNEKKTHSPSFESFIDDDNCVGNVNEDNIKEIELNAYKVMTVAKEGFDLLSWWYQHRNAFPNLYKIAVYIHSIPATSTPAERAFSTASNHITEKRNNLRPDTADALIFLNSNDDFFEKTLTSVNRS